MKDEFKGALDAVHADEALKARTRSYLTRERKRVPVRPMLAAAACLALVLLGSWWVYFLPTAAISVDINPSIELGVNRFDRVLTVTGRNAGGEALAKAVDLRYLACTEAIDALLGSGEIAALLARGEECAITVVGDNGEQSARLLAGAEECAKGHGETHCYSVSRRDVEGAHRAGLSHGKYRAYLELLALDPTITVEDVQNMTMAEIRARMAGLSGHHGHHGH